MFTNIHDHINNLIQRTLFSYPLGFDCFYCINTPLYGLSPVPLITMIEQKKLYIATIFEHNFYTYFFRKCYEEVDLKKVIIIF